MKRSNITKDEILKTINSSLGTPLSLSEKILNEILNIIVDGLNSENIVKIKGFGTFKTLNKKPPSRYRYGACGPWENIFTRCN